MYVQFYVKVHDPFPKILGEGFILEDSISQI